MPTVKKNMPSNRPLNGSTVAFRSPCDFGLGEEKPGDERAERHGQAA